jgi:hypothetical protein
VLYSYDWKIEDGLGNRENGKKEKGEKKISTIRNQVFFLKKKKTIKKEKG